MAASGLPGVFLGYLGKPFMMSCTLVSFPPIKCHSLLPSIPAVSGEAVVQALGVFGALEQMHQYFG